MEKEKTKISIEATAKAPVEKVWKLWTEPEHIMQWNTASPDCHTPKAENNLREGGEFVYRMEAKDAVLDLTLKAFMMPSLRTSKSPILLAMEEK